jgi:hypothetical protein
MVEWIQHKTLDTDQSILNDDHQYEKAEMEQTAV